MIKSMTGYGSAKGTVEGIEVSVELKSVNNKFLDTSVRLPRSFIFAEETVKAAVQSHISRGKVDVFVTVDTSMADDMVVRVNEPLLKGYIDALQHIADEYALPNDISVMSVSRFPDILSVEKKELDADAVADGIKSIAEQALQDFDGTLIIVSHDRDFLDGLVTKVYEFGHQRVREHLCGIYEFLETRRLENLQELERRA